MHQNPTTDRPIVKQAVRALQGFGDPLDRDQAAALLDLWRHRHALEQHERSAVLAAFPAVEIRQAPSDFETTDDPEIRHPRAGSEPAEQLCATCDGSIEWTKHPDRDQSGWRHTSDHGQEPHGAHPAGGAA